MTNPETAQKRVNNGIAMALCDDGDEAHARHQIVMSEKVAPCMTVSGTWQF